MGNNPRTRRQWRRQCRRAAVVMMVDGATDGPQPRQARIVLMHNQGGDIVALLGWNHNSLKFVTPETLALGGRFSGAGYGLFMGGIRPNLTIC